MDGKEQERRQWFRVDDTRRIRLTRSESLPDIRSEHVQNAIERDIDFRRTDRRAIERNDRRLLENRFGERIFKREVRDTRYERQTTRDDIIEARRRTAYIRQVLEFYDLNFIKSLVLNKSCFVYRIIWTPSTTRMTQLHGKFS